MSDGPPRLEGNEGGDLGPELDLTKEKAPGRTPSLTLIPYDPEPARERMRGQIAILLLGLLIGIVAFAFIVLSWSEERRWLFLKEYLTIVFGPVTTLVGAVTGFYYGSVQKK